MELGNAIDMLSLGVAIGVFAVSRRAVSPDDRVSPWFLSVAAGFATFTLLSLTLVVPDGMVREYLAYGALVGLMIGAIVGFAEWVMGKSLKGAMRGGAIVAAAIVFGLGASPAFLILAA